MCFPGGTFDGEEIKGFSRIKMVVKIAMVTAFLVENFLLKVFCVMAILGSNFQIATTTT